MESVLSLATVSRNGAVLLGRNVAADGYARRLVRVVTHAHYDHILGLRRSLRASLYIVATPTTHRFLEVLGYAVPEEKRIELRYGSSIEIDGERITLLRAQHIAGSSQVLVEGPNYRVGYTGDFKEGDTVPLRDLDVLVLDATYGDPQQQRSWSDWKALERLICLIDKSLNHGPVWIYGYHGKLQEVMVRLREAGVWAPFYAEPVSVKLARIAESFYGKRLGKIYEYAGGPLDESAIVFIHASKRRSMIKLPGVHILLSGWEMREIVRRVSERYYIVSYSDHATLREIISYLHRAKPRRIVIDGYRAKKPRETATYLESKLGIPVTVAP